MRKLEDIESRLLVLVKALRVLSTLVEDTTDPAQLRELQARFATISAEIDQLQRDAKMAVYRLHNGTYP